MSSIDPLFPESPSEVSSEPIPRLQRPEEPGGQVLEGDVLEVPRQPEQRPHPGFGWSLVWCAGFILFTQTPGALIAVGYIVLVLVLAPDLLPTQVLQTPQGMLQNDVVSMAMLLAMAVTELVVIGFSLLVLRLVAGRDWRRQVGLRLPTWFHLLLCLAAFPALVLVANGSHVLFSILMEGATISDLGAYVMATLVGFCFPLAVFRLVGGEDWPAALRWPRDVPAGSPAHSLLGQRPWIVRHLSWLGIGVPLGVLAGWGTYLGVRWLLVAGFGPGLTHQSEKSLMEEMVNLFGRWDLTLAILIIGLGPGIGEELWCRAFLGRGLVARYGPIVGVVLTSFFFGLIHLEPRQGTMAALMGLCLHYSYLTTRSLLVPMLLHFLNNSFAVTVIRFAQFRDLEAKPGSIPWFIFAAAGLMLVAVAWALFATRARLVAQEPDPEGWKPEYPGASWPPPGVPVQVVRPLVWSALVPAALAFLVFLGACAWAISRT
jgi:membrane protease YdiL (CAAX protease family)